MNRSLDSAFKRPKRCGDRKCSRRSESSNEIHCKLCNVYISSKKCLSEHLNGRKHVIKQLGC